MIAPLVSLIDTNILSETTQPSPKTRVTVYLNPIADEDLGAASFTVRHVLDGLGRRTPSRCRHGLPKWLENVLEALNENRIVKRPLVDAIACARILADKRRRDQPSGGQLSGAFSIAVLAARGFAILTYNSGELGNTDIHSIDPWTEA